MEYLLMLYKHNRLCECGHNWTDHDERDQYPEEEDVESMLGKDTFEDEETKLVYQTNWNSNDFDDYCACRKKDGCYYFKPITQLKFIELLNKVKHEQEAT